MTNMFPVMKLKPTAFSSLMRAKNAVRKQKGRALGALWQNETAANTPCRQKHRFGMYREFKWINSFRFESYGCEIVYGLKSSVIEVDTIFYGNFHGDGGGTNTAQPSSHIEPYLELTASVVTSSGLMPSDGRFISVAFIEHTDAILAWLQRAELNVKSDSLVLVCTPGHGIEFLIEFSCKFESDTSTITDSDAVWSFEVNKAQSFRDDAIAFANVHIDTAVSDALEDASPANFVNVITQLRETEFGFDTNADDNEKDLFLTFAHQVGRSDDNLNETGALRITIITDDALTDAAAANGVTVTDFSGECDYGCGDDAGAGDDVLFLTVAHHADPADATFVDATALLAGVIIGEGLDNSATANDVNFAYFGRGGDFTIGADAGNNNSDLFPTLAHLTDTADAANGVTVMDCTGADNINFDGNGGDNNSDLFLTVAHHADPADATSVDATALLAGVIIGEGLDNATTANDVNFAYFGRGGDFTIGADAGNNNSDLFPTLAHQTDTADAGFVDNTVLLVSVVTDEGQDDADAANRVTVTDCTGADNINFDGNGGDNNSDLFLTVAHHADALNNAGSDCDMTNARLFSENRSYLAGAVTRNNALDRQSHADRGIDEESAGFAMLVRCLNNAAPFDDPESTREKPELVVS